jgi:ubiquitin C-terminal hydrolase
LNLNLKRTGGVAEQLEKYFDIQTRTETCRSCKDDTLLSKKFLAGAPHILMVELESFNHTDLGAKRLKLNKPMPLTLNLDNYTIMSVDSTQAKPNGDYKLIAAICIDGKRKDKFSYYALVLKKFQKFNTEKWIRYNTDSCHVAAH